MASNIGKCGLCLTDNAVLRESHLLPAALYDLLRDRSEGTDPNPVHVTREKSFTSSRHIRAPFLCDECEDRFSANGETYVINQCNRHDSTFRLRKMLQRTSSPLWQLENYKLYDVAPILGKNTEQYLYFGASVFWRAGAQSWKGCNRIKLGKYQEQLRLYLLGKEKFPTEGRLILHVSVEDNLTDLILPPTTARSKHGPLHRFYIPGIVFTLCLGRAVVENVYNAIALNSSKGKFMLLCPWRDDPMFRMMRAFVKKSPAVEKLLELKRRP